MLAIITLLIVAIGIGFAVNYWSFVLGDPHEGHVQGGRILSNLGRFLLAKYHATEATIDGRIMRETAAALKKARDRWATEHPDQPFPADHPALSSVKGDRPNWWKMTGVCPRCCLVWAALPAFGVTWGLFDLSGWCWFGFVPFVGFANLALALADMWRD